MNFNKKYNSFIVRRNKKLKKKNYIYNKEIFNTQKINNHINDIINEYGNNINNNNKKENKKKYQSIQQYEYITYDKKIINNKNISEKKLLYTQDNKCKNNNTFDKNLFIQKENINNDNFYSKYNNKYNSLSNILKNKKMISSPILDFGLNNLDINNNICNNNDNDNDIKTKNKNGIESIDNKNNNNIDKDSINSNAKVNSLNSEIVQLKKEIISIQKNNNILLAKLKEEKKKHISLSSFESENENMPNDIELNNILNEISNNLAIKSFDEIVPKLKEMIEYLNINIYEKNEANKKRNELILKLRELYISSNIINEKKGNISIKVIWRWIKNLINNYKSLLVEKAKKEEILKNLENNDNFYKESCDELMAKYKKNNLEELNKFIEELIKRNNINRKRVEQLKKILVNDNKSNGNGLRNNINNENNFKIIMNYNQQNIEDITFNTNY